ncbi:HEAT repeat domain-containing protein [Actinosynnema sp. NPDC020468]|uniref:HEAT repeat domain-containing protein n=1 Tax=Actinosynnema sp. NPDC020468 TaxID=3154488 RepID=UPI0033DEAF36
MAMELMRRQDPQAQEDGFGMLRAHVGEHVEELVVEFRHEGDHGLRCWLLELIGEARSQRALPLLVEQLHGDDEALRDWARRGLELLDTREARQELWRELANGQ